MAREVKYLLKKANYSKGERYMRNQRYHDSRPTKNSKKGQMDPEDMPQHQGMGRPRSGNWTNGVDTHLVKRWLYSQVGKDFDHVYSEFLKRVQSKYLDEYRDCIYYYVVKKALVEIIDEEPYGLVSGIGPKKLPYSKWSCFFIHPDTNILHVASTYKRKK